MRCSLAQSTSPQVFFLSLSEKVKHSSKLHCNDYLLFLCACFEDPAPKAEITVDNLAKHFNVRVKADDILKISLCYKKSYTECEQLTYFGLVGLIHCISLSVYVFEKEGNNFLFVTQASFMKHS